MSRAVECCLSRTDVINIDIREITDVINVCFSIATYRETGILLAVAVEKSAETNGNAVAETNGKRAKSGTHQF